ncbi:hypothetical protein PhCBS80983_g00256 [Powellomyces hirtus]|uniref:Signal peptidase complex subunit 2 n=1 Tax=Powellomyces hirtus TaxID=109895 RepID=A0A507EFI9_9FUNG|nr:hypothetical protein PhCBS80983_g00256 [Powellomyces hirtus]
MANKKRDTPVPSVVDTSTSVFCAEQATHPVIINNSNDSEMKHTLDDALKRVLVQDFKFTEIHTHIDRRLLLGFASVAFAAYASVYSYIVPFPECKPVLLVCVAAYFILNGALMLYIQHVEQNVIFQGVRRDPLGLEPDQKIVVRTSHEPFTPEYTVIFNSGSDQAVASAGAAVKQTKAKKSSGTVTLVKSFGEYFDVEGRLAPEVFVKHIAGAVNACGMKIE